MLASSRKNKEKKLYSSKILYKAPNIYETYKRMVKIKNITLSELNTSLSSIDCLSKRTDNNMTTKNSELRYNLINLIDSNEKVKVCEEKEKKIKKNKPYLSYLGFLESKGFGFFSNEQRFKWQNTENYNYPTGINTFQKTKKHINISYDSKKEYQFKRQKKYIISSSNDNSFEQTQRVLNTNRNNKKDKKEVKEDFLNKNSKKRLNLQKFVNVGGIAELLKKTPIKEKIKGVKRIKKNNSYELNLFRNDYAKFELPTKVKKHFIEKNIDNDIFGLKKFKSMNNKDFKERKMCKIFNNYVEKHYKLEYY